MQTKNASDLHKTFSGQAVSSEFNNINEQWQRCILGYQIRNSVAQKKGTMYLSNTRALLQTIIVTPHFMKTFCPKRLQRGYSQHIYNVCVSFDTMA